MCLRALVVKSPGEASRRFRKTADGLISDSAAVAFLYLREVLLLGQLPIDFSQHRPPGRARRFVGQKFFPEVFVHTIIRGN